MNIVTGVFVCLYNKNFMHTYINKYIVVGREDGAQKKRDTKKAVTANGAKLPDESKHNNG